MIKTRLTFRILILSAVMLSGSLTTSAQKDYKPETGINDYDYYIKGELVLDYNTNLYFKEMDQKLSKKYHLNAPLFIVFNSNDIKHFRAEPGEIADYADTFLSTANYFYNNRGEGEKFAGMVYATEWVETTTGEMVSVKSAKGYIDQAINISFKMPDVERSLSSGKKDFRYRLFISAVSCNGCPQQNVTGWSETEGYRITEGIQLDISFEPGVSFGTDMVNHIIANKMETVEGEEKDKFEDAFEREYFKNLPETDAVKLNEFLLNPKGIYEIPVSGYLNSPDGKSEKTVIKGTLRLFGNEVYKYWVEKPEQD